MWFAFWTKCKINDFFNLKDRIPSFLRNSVVFKFQCGGCNPTCYGKIKRHCKVKMREYLRMSVLTGKRVKGDDDPAIMEQLYAAVTRLILNIFLFSQPTATSFKLPS